MTDLPQPLTPWSERLIARAIALQTFKRRYLVAVPNCTWTGYECDLLVVTDDLRIIDIEIKISRADLKVDAKKMKWWETYFQNSSTKLWQRHDAPVARVWPPKAWKHYYAMPREIWKPELADVMPSPASGILLLDRPRHASDPSVIVNVERRCTPNKAAERIAPADAIDIARLASLRMWESYLEVEAMQRRAA